MADPASSLGQDPKHLWQIITEKLREELPHQSFLTWFKPIKALSFDGRVLTLHIPSRFYYDWIEGHYNGHLKRAIKESLGGEIELAYSVDPERRTVSVDADAASIRARVIPPAQDRDRVSDNYLNPRYRFDNFIEGDCNRFARAAAMSLAEAPGKTPFNPLMIYGGSGLGKTHLMQAIGNHIVEHGRARKVLYVTSEQFTADFIKAIQSSRSDSFSRIYRKVDVLLLDDVQFFMAKDKTQEEFFHTFNSLHHAGKQLVFSSDRPPRELEGFNARLVSRLQWGLVSELRTPEYETRIAILKNRAGEAKIDLPDEVAHFLATHITDNVRSLQSALIHMLAQSTLIGRKISIDLARDVLKNLSNRPLQAVSVERIQDMVAKEFGIPSDLLRSKTRKKDVVQARQIAMFLSTEFTRLTLKAIGLHFGGRDHATVIHARETINEGVKSSRDMAEAVESLRHRIELTAL